MGNIPISGIVPSSVTQTMYCKRLKYALIIPKQVEAKMNCVAPLLAPSTTVRQSLFYDVDIYPPYNITTAGPC